MIMNDEEWRVWRLFDEGWTVGRIDRALKLKPGTARKMIVGIWSKDREEAMKRIRGIMGWGRDA